MCVRTNLLIICFKCYINLIVAGHNIDLFALKVYLFVRNVLLCNAGLLFLTSEDCLKVGFGFLSLYIIFTYVTLAMSLILYLYSALLSFLYFGNYFMEIIIKYTFYLFSTGSQSVEDTFPFSSRLFSMSLQNFKYPQDVQTSIFLLLYLLNVFQVLSKVKQLFKNATQRSVLKQES